MASTRNGRSWSAARGSGSSIIKKSLRIAEVRPGVRPSRNGRSEIFGDESGIEHVTCDALSASAELELTTITQNHYEISACWLPRLSGLFHAAKYSRSCGQRQTRLFPGE